MTQPSIERIKSLIAVILAPKLTAAGVVTLTDDLDLRDEGVLDSLGFVELITALEIQLGTPLDLADLDAEHLTRVGALARHIAGDGPVHAV
jgi:acyl carrier protein